MNKPKKSQRRPLVVIKGEDNRTLAAVATPDGYLIPANLECMGELMTTLFRQSGTTQTEEDLFHSITHDGTLTEDSNYQHHLTSFLFARTREHNRKLITTILNKLNPTIEYQGRTYPVSVGTAPATRNEFYFYIKVKLPALYREPTLLKM